MSRSAKLSKRWGLLLIQVMNFDGDKVAAIRPATAGARFEGRD